MNLHIGLSSKFKWVRVPWPTILWIIDAIVDYYTSGVLDAEGDEVDIDMEAVADYVCRRAKEEKVSQSFNSEDVIIMVQADLDFQEQNLA